MSIAIKAENLSISAGRREILSLPSLQIEKGEIFGILGPNGAGKSTFIKSLIGLGNISGSLEVLGQDITTSSHAGLTQLRRCVGYVPQMPPIQGIMPLTLREVVLTGRCPSAAPGKGQSKHNMQIADKWIGHFGLGNIVSQRYCDCSGGEQRKTLLARAMTQNPKLLLLDEPTANLDIRSREQMISLVSEINSDLGVTVVLICHELEVLPASCDKLMVIKDSKPISIGRPKTVLSDQLVTTLYGHHLRLHEYAGRYFAIPDREAAHD